MSIFDKFFTKFAYKFPKGYPDMNNDQDVLLLESELSKVLGEKINIAETPLTPRELSKNNSKTNISRINILIDAIKNNKPLELEKGGVFVVYDPKGEKTSELKSWSEEKGAVTLFDVDGNSITTSKLKKSSDFGGGKGSGGGAAQTSIQESSQCAVSALIQEMGQITIEDLTPENLKSISGDIDTTSTIDEIIEFITNSPNWSNTFIETSKKLSEYIGGGFKFHRGSIFVDSIYDAWKTVKKANGWSISSDKWNPSDIWALKSTDVTFKTDDIAALNNQLRELFEEKKLIGISLKKLGPNSKLTIVNQEPQSSKVELESIIVSPNSKDAYIVTTSGHKLQLRTTTNDGRTFQGELKGKTANQGKIGGGILKMFLEKHNVGNIPSQKEAYTLAKNPSPEFIDDLIELIKSHGNFKITEEELKLKSTDWLSSKYQALSIVKALELADKSNVTEALTDIVNYAGSQSSISSIYLKVS